MNISGINSNLFNTGNTVLNDQVKTVTSTSAAEKAADQNEDANGGISKDGDTVSISTAGTFLQKTYQSSSQSTLDYLQEDTTSGIDSVAKAVASAASSAGISTEATAKSQASGAVSTVSSSDSSSSTSDLSQYTASELKEMLQNGEITRQEYNEEIASRQQAEETETDEESEEQETASDIN